MSDTQESQNGSEIENMEVELDNESFRLYMNHLFRERGLFEYMLSKTAYATRQKEVYKNEPIPPFVPKAWADEFINNLVKKQKALQKALRSRRIKYRSG
jgi:hypothetical protein